MSYKIKKIWDWLIFLGCTTENDPDGKYWCSTKVRHDLFVYAITPVTKACPSSAAGVPDPDYDGPDPDPTLKENRKN